MTGVKLLGRRVAAFGEKATTGSKPFQIHPVGDVVGDPVHGDDDQTQHKCPCEIVVQPFAALRDGRKPFFPEKRDQEITAIKGQQAGQAKYKERPGEQPVAETAQNR